MEYIVSHLQQTYIERRRDNRLGEWSRIEHVNVSQMEMQTSEPTWKEVKEIVKKERSGSAPGPNGIPYRVYIICPLLLRRLWTLSRVAWMKGNMPSCCQVAEKHITPKRKMQKTLRSSEQYHRWMWKARFVSLYLPRDWQSLWQTTTMSTHLCRREEF